jgi:hypothetical protein
MNYKKSELTLSELYNYVAGIWKNVSTKEGEVIYWENEANLSQFDPDHPDGTFAIKSKGRYYIEQWKNGYRYNYTIISEEKFNHIIKNLKQ